MKTCLVIDDSRVIRKVARRILEDIGFMVDEAEDGAVGLDMCRSSMPEIIFVDSLMPNLDGVGFMKALRRETVGPVPKMILWTTENDESQVIQARAAGAADVMLKPFDKETIEGHLAAIGVFVRQ